MPRKRTRGLPFFTQFLVGFSYESTKATTSDGESKGIPTSIVIGSVDCHVVPDEHADKVKPDNQSVPETSPESILMTHWRLTLHDFVVSTAG